MNQDDNEKFQKVVRLHEQARNFGFAVLWRSFGWALIPVDAVDAIAAGEPPHTEIFAQGTSLEQLEYFIKGVAFTDDGKHDE